MDFTAAFTAWRKQPGPEAREVLLRAIQAQRNFVDRLDVEETVTPLLEAGNFGPALAELRRWMPGAFFSPSTHELMAQAAEGLGNEKAAAWERSLVRYALRSIYTSGDGSAARPWQVLRINDEWDVVRSLGKRPSHISTHDHFGQMLDVLSTMEGDEYWFALRNNGSRIRGAA